MGGLPVCSLSLPLLGSSPTCYPGCNAPHESLEKRQYGGGRSYTTNQREAWEVPPSGSHSEYSFGFSRLSLPSLWISHLQLLHLKFSSLSSIGCLFRKLKVSSRFSSLARAKMALDTGCLLHVAHIWPVASHPEEQPLIHHPPTWPSPVVLLPALTQDPDPICRQGMPSKASCEAPLLP